jgi:hypothetical protein
MLMARRQHRVPLLNFLLLFDYSLGHVTNTHPASKKRIAISSNCNEQNSE